MFAHCDQPMVGLFRTSIELWGVDPADGAVMDNAHAEVDLTDHTSMTYSCDLVGGLTRRMFDARFQRTVVQVRDPGTGAEWVAEVALTDGDPPRPPAPAPASRFAPHPHEDLAVYGPDGQTVWYRSANDGTVHRVPDSIRILRRPASMATSEVALRSGRLPGSTTARLSPSPAPNVARTGCCASR